MTEAAVEGFVDLALRFRREVTLLLSEAAEATKTPVFDEHPEPGERLVHELAARSARPQDRLRAWMVLTAMGLAAAGTVAIAVLVALTLLPAVLGFAGERVLHRR